jgi:hypothetical protein
VAHDIPHDHCLLLSSPEGQQALWSWDITQPPLSSF